MQEMELFDLTNPQKSIWYTEEVFKGTTINNICTSGLIYEKIDLDLLKKAINLVVKQNDSFRIHVVLQDGNVKQYISDYKNFDIDIKYINSSDELKNAQQEEAKHVFNMIDSDLFKFKIVVLKDVFTCVVLTANHIISDSWSMGITIQEILRNYHELQNRKSADFGDVFKDSNKTDLGDVFKDSNKTDLGGVFKDSNKANFGDNSNSSSGNGFEVYSYANFINSEKAYKNSQKFENDKKFWKNIFETIPEQATIPGSLSKQFEQSKSIGKASNVTNIANLSNATNIANPSNATNPANDISTSSLLNVEPSYAAERLSFGIDKELMSKINAFCKKNHFSVFSFFMALFSLYIGRVSNSDDFVIGTPILNRVNPEEKHTTGMFVNTAPVRVNLLNNETFANFASSFSQKIMGILRHQKYSYNSILEDIRSNHKNVPNLYNILISYQVTKAFDSQFGNYKTDWTFNKSLANDMNIHIYDINDTGSVLISYDYLLSKYCLQDIKDLHARIVNMINQVLENNEILSCNIDIVTEAEKKKILYDFNNTFKYYPKNKTISELFEAQVEETPDNVALVFGEKQMTYRELNEKSNCLASFLRHQKNIGRNDLVGIMCNRSFEMIISILAVLKAGGAYIPIDPTFPKDRINYMLENSRAKVLLTQKHLDDAVVFDDKTFVDLDEALFDDRACSNLKPISKPDDLAYVIYTSGSTGVPKGVMITHKVLSNFINYCNDNIDYLKSGKHQTIVSITTISFDIFFYEAIISLQKGLKVVIANENEQNSPNLLNKLINKYDVQIIQSTPSRMQVFLNNIASMPSLKNLKYVILAGEQLPLSLVKSLHSLSNITVYNGYGPSETYYSTLTKVNDDFITIGKPIYNTQMYILSNSLKPLPIGVQGEIYIAGEAVGKGYINNIDLTSKRFIRDPFIKNNIMYKTGDIGMYLPDGNIVCLGRSDYQVKIRGLRIELGEIENKINDLPFINSCVVVKRTDTNLHEGLFAYFTANTKVDVNDIRSYLIKFLPRYMIPSAFIQMDSLPYTPNGKIDRKNLPDPGSHYYEKDVVLPRNDVDFKLVQMLESILQIDNISIDDDFFDIGGDSLSAITLCANIQNIFNVQLFVKDILEHSQIQNLSDVISKKEHVSKHTSISPAPKADFYETSSAQKRMYYTSQLAGNNSVVYNLPGGVIFDGVVDIKKLEQCFITMINRHEALRTFFELNGDVVQKILDTVDFKLDVYKDADFNELDSIFKEFVKPFDLSKAPLFRAKFIQFTNGKSALFLDMHHIISDGTSLSILTEELCKLYNGSSLPKLNITYKDFASFESEMLKTGIMKDAEKYWTSQFDDEIPILNMPANHVRPSIQSFKGKKVYSIINLNTTKKIEQVSKTLGITPYMLLLSCYYILLSKYTSQDDIVVGSPIVGRDTAETNNIIGMFVNTLALRNKVNDWLSFKQFALNVKNNVLEAFKYQTYPFDELVKALNIKKDTSRNPLFDTCFIYQNDGYKSLDFNEVKAEYYIPDIGISKFDLSLEVVPSNEYINLSFEYATSLFDDGFIKNLSAHYLNILDVVLNNVDTKLADIDMLSIDEKNKILYEFNNSELPYPKDKSVIELFEKQVEKNPNNVAVVFESRKLTYKDLNKKVNMFANYLLKYGVCKGSIVPVIIDRSTDLIVAMLAVAKLGAVYLPISIDTPIDRINYILKDGNIKFVISNKDYDFSKNIKLINIVNADYSNFNSENINTLIAPTDLLYIIYTSGSTGKPKGVKVCHNNLINFVYSFNNIYKNISSNDKLLASTNISFDVSIFEFFMPLLNGFTLYLYNEPTISNIHQYCKTIVENNITFAYIPPNILEVVYDLLSSYDNIKLNKILLGVEPIKTEIIKKYYTLSSNLKVVNAYGPTETTICATGVLLDNYIIDNYDILPIGKPLNNLKILILDKNLQPVPIGVPGEIYIAGDNVSKGYLNNKELTDKSFIGIPSLNIKYAYKTGDLAKWDTSGIINFIGRNDNQIKINGHRIELHEIESVLQKYSYIEKAIVLKRTVNNRDVICAYYISKKDLNISEIRLYLSKFLPSYMIPSYFVGLDEFPYTSNGKLDRKNLPEPDYTSFKKEIILPKNNIDSKLIEIIKLLLHADNISMDDNFFEIGGDSLSAINLCVQVQKEFNINLSVRDVLEKPIIQDLSAVISNNESKTNNVFINKIPEAEFYDVSFAQRRIYFSTKASGNSTLYNIPGGVIFKGYINVQKLQKCFNILISRHEALRTYFELNNEKVVQKVIDDVDFKFDILENESFENLDSLFKDFVKPFDLSIAPLLRAKIIMFSNGMSVLFIDMHHIISDGTSITVLINELCRLYNGEKLPALEITYKDFSVFENNMVDSGILKASEEYWVNQFSDDIPVLNMPTTYTRPAIQNFDGKKIYSLINKTTTKKIEKFSNELGITPFMLLLSIYYIVLSKYTSQDDIVVGCPIANRSLPQVSSLIGMFVNTLALRNKIDSSLSFKDFVLSIKEHLLEAYKFQSYPFDELVNKLNVKREPSRSLLFDTMFIYQNNIFPEINFDGIKADYYISDTNISKFDLSLEATHISSEIKLCFEYATSLFDEGFIINLSNHYLNILEVVLNNCDTKIADIDMLSKEERNKILYKFNDTYEDLPKDATVIHLFEAQVKKTPSAIAIECNDKQITYSDFNKKVNQVARMLRNIGVGRNDFVAIVAKRSIEMMIGIFGIIKSGAAYVPIDPNYPEERKNHILNDCAPKVVLLANADIETDISKIDLTTKTFETEDDSNLEIINKPEDAVYCIYTSGTTGKPKGVVNKHIGLINRILWMNGRYPIKEGDVILQKTTYCFDVSVWEIVWWSFVGAKVCMLKVGGEKEPEAIIDAIEKNNITTIHFVPSMLNMMLVYSENMTNLKNKLKSLKYVFTSGEELKKKQVEMFFKRIKSVKPNVKLINVYGPTEASIDVTYYECKKDDKIIPIGKPISNIQIYILDGLKPCGIGVAGEICIGGIGVAKGYLNRDDLNKEKFIDNPFSEGKLYRTGDLGRWLEDGNVEYLGRIDHQVKIRGLRIELDEIENLILKFPHIKNVAVVKQTIQSRDFITSYYVSDKRININDLRKYIAKSLPKYMVPSYFIALDDLPYSLNGKLDRKSLPLPTELLNISEEEFVPAKTKLQQQLVNIWEKVLSIKPIGINDNFFELGGDSLMAMSLNIELRKLSNNIVYSDIFRYPTIAELEEKILSNDDSPLFKKIESLSDNYVDILKNTKNFKRIKTWHPRNILLTGATGFLGIHILNEFLKNENGNVYCIVRDEPNLSSNNKLRQKLNYYFGDKYDELIGKRIFAVTGNISKPGFGLSEKDLLNLVDNIDLVINSAANVAHYGNYSKFYDTNVKSVKYIVDFCKSFNKKLYHISTISVTGLNLDSSYLMYKKKRWHKRKEIVFDEGYLYVGQIIDNVYARSKFEAEHYILNAISTGLDGYLLRMGHLMPRSKDGVFQENILDNDLINMIVSFVKIGALPDYLLKYPLEFTPVDIASNAIYKLVTHPTNTNRIFHLYNHNTFYASKLLKKLNHYNYDISVLEEDKFINKIKKILQDEESKKILKNLLNNFDDELHLNYTNDIILKSSFSIKYLRRIGFRWHKISNKYLIRLIDLLRKVI